MRYAEALKNDLTDFSDLTDLGDLKLTVRCPEGRFDRLEPISAI